MARAVAHRGPDGEGDWYEGQVALAHRRLAIRDFSSAAHQPLQSACGRIVVSTMAKSTTDRRCKRSSHGHRLVSRSTSDTEIIPVGYLARGPECSTGSKVCLLLPCGTGRKRELVLARDGVGVKPLDVRGHVTSCVSAASPRRCSPIGLSRLHHRKRLHTGLGARPSRTGQKPARRGRQVPPGVIRTIGREGDRTRRFWRPKRRPDTIDVRGGRCCPTLPRVVAINSSATFPSACCRRADYSTADAVAAATRDHARLHRPLPRSKSRRGRLPAWLPMRRAPHLISSCRTRPRGEGLPRLVNISTAKSRIRARSRPIGWPRGAQARHGRAVGRRRR